MIPGEDTPANCESAGPRIGIEKQKKFDEMSMEEKVNFLQKCVVVYAEELQRRDDRTRERLNKLEAHSHQDGKIVIPLNRCY